jgi:hypothetical protein
MVIRASHESNRSISYAANRFDWAIVQMASCTIEHGATADVFQKAAWIGTTALSPPMPSVGKCARIVSAT